jgi:anaerobic nitric oxide reductase transcription regulator
VGEDTPKYVDVRVVAATNRNLKEEVAQGHFRADLYHRLSVYPITVPPLKEREHDVTLLAGYFIEQTARKLGIKQLKLSGEAHALLNQYNWPGNVRELEHVVSRSALKAKQGQWQNAIITITAEHCDLTLQAQPHSISALPNAVNTMVNQSLKLSVKSLQYRVITEQLKQHNYNWAAVARVLKIDRANLVRLAKRVGIKVKKTL